MRMLEQEWKGVYKILNDGNGKNSYVERIRSNISRVNLMARSLNSSCRAVVARESLVD